MMKHPLSRTFAAILAFVACAAADGRAQDRLGCAALSSVREFCTNRWTVSAIVTFPQAQRWVREKNPGSENSSDRARVTISCDHDGDETNPDDETRDHKDTQGQSDGMTMFLWHPTIGTRGLAYSKMLHQRGLVFSMVPFDRLTRRSTSGTTPGTFVILNRCELLQEGHLNGVIFEGSQIMPLSFNGSIDQDSSDWDQSDTMPTLPSTREPSAQEVATSLTDSAATPAEVARLKVDPWDFSGIYEFDVEDEDCLTKKGLMKNYKELSENEALGYIAPELRIYTRQQRTAQPNRYWEKLCPPRKATLVVDALAGETPIYILDQGSFVTHHVIGQWNGKRRFHSVTPNGDTTGPNRGMFKIEGEINLDGSLDFFVFKPNLGKTGRLWPVASSSKIWTTIDPFHAVKKLDVYCHLHIRPDKDCVLWNRQDWTGYLHKTWKETQKSLGIN